MTGRCEKHGLAIGPDGRCVICRRESGVPVAGLPRSKPGQLKRDLQIVLGVVVVAAAACLVWLMLWPQTFPLRPPEKTRAPAVQKAGPSHALAARPPASPKPEVAEPDPRPAVTRPDARERIEVISPEGARHAAEDLARKEKVEADLQDEAFRNARKRVDVILYANAWCPYCAKARTYLKSRGIDYTEFDVEADEASARKRDQINPKRSVPTFLIDQIVVVGFDANRLERAIDTAARARAERLLNQR